MSIKSLFFTKLQFPVIAQEVDEDHLPLPKVERKKKKSWSWSWATRLSTQLSDVSEEV